MYVSRSLAQRQSGVRVIKKGLQRGGSAYYVCRYVCPTSSLRMEEGGIPMTAHRVCWIDMHGMEDYPVGLYNLRSLQDRTLLGDNSDLGSRSASGMGRASTGRGSIQSRHCSAAD
jgi:hypothetical protein